MGDTRLNHLFDMSLKNEEKLLRLFQDCPQIVDMYAAWDDQLPGMDFTGRCLLLEDVHLPFNDYLAQVNNNTIKFTFRDFRSILLDAAKALEYVHAKGYVHGDNHQENFCVEAGMKSLSPVGKLIDFDLNQETSSPLARKGDVDGFFYYMYAPSLRALYNAGNEEFDQFRKYIEASPFGNGTWRGFLSMTTMKEIRTFLEGMPI